jgi:hypothetical protein
MNRPLEPDKHGYLGLVELEPYATAIALHSRSRKADTTQLRLPPQSTSTKCCDTLEQFINADAFKLLS